MNEDRVAIMQARIAAGKARWAGVSKGERSREMQAVRAAGGGRKRSTERCFCGRYTMHTARQRGFDCCKRAGKWRDPHCTLKHEGPCNPCCNPYDY